MFLPGDRIQSLATRGTLEFLRYSDDGQSAVCRNRYGTVQTEPLGVLDRAPLIQGCQGVGYEWEEGIPVMFRKPGQLIDDPTLTEGVFQRYLTAKELQAQFPSGYPQTNDLVKVQDGEGNSYQIRTQNMIRDPERAASMVWDVRTYRKNRKIQKFPELAELLKQLDWENIDWNGHNRDGRKSQGGVLSQEETDLSWWVEGTGSPTLEQMQQIKEVVEAGEWLPNGEWLPIGKPRHSHWLHCTYCGQVPYLETDGKRVRLAGPRCPFPEGNLDVTFRLSFPSGKVLVNDDLRDFAPIKEDHSSINTLKGQAEWTAECAKAGLALGSVGNSCPSVWRMADGSFTVANWAYESEMGEQRIPEGVTGLTGILTDLWAYSIMSLDLAESRAKWAKIDLKDLIEKGSVSVIEIEPGEYEFKHHTGAGRQDGGDKVYCTFRRVGDAKPVFPDTYLEQWLSEDLTAHQVLAQTIKDGSDLYNGGVLEQQVVRAADHLLCTIGSGVEWHENGFPVTNMDKDTVPLAEIPVFRGRYPWYPYSPGYSGLMQAAGLAGYGETEDRPFERCLYLNPSFQELAYRVLQNIIRYGLTPYQDHWDPRMAEERKGFFQFKNQAELDAHSDEQTRNRIRNAVRAFNRLAERWPDTFGGVDPEFTAWMAQSSLVEDWVERMQLTPYNQAEPPREDQERHPGRRGYQTYMPILGEGWEKVTAERAARTKARLSRMWGVSPTESEKSKVE